MVNIMTTAVSVSLQFLREVSVINDKSFKVNKLQIYCCRESSVNYLKLLS